MSVTTYLILIRFFSNYVVAGWASVNENVEGPAVYDLLESYISDQESIAIEKNEAVKVIGL